MQTRILCIFILQQFDIIVKDKFSLVVPVASKLLPYTNIVLVHTNLKEFESVIQISNIYINNGKTYVLIRSYLRFQFVQFRFRFSVNLDFL